MCIARNIPTWLVRWWCVTVDDVAGLEGHAVVRGSNAQRLALSADDQLAGSYMSSNLRDGNDTAVGTLHVPAPRAPFDGRQQVESGAEMRRDNLLSADRISELQEHTQIVRIVHGTDMSEVDPRGGPGPMR